MAIKRTVRTPKELFEENEDLRARLAEAEETLRAIRAGEVDALLVSTAAGEQVFTLKGADRSYRELIENMNEGALSLTADGTILYANQKFAAMLKTPLEEVIGSSIHAWVAPEGRGRLDVLLQNGGRRKCREELTLVAADDLRIPAYLSVNPASTGELHDSLGVVVTDLTEQKRHQEALADLKQHLQRDIEMERLQLAQNLHDVPLQELYGIIYELGDLRGQSEPASAEVLGRVIEDLRKTLASLRATATELRPPTLSRFGLEPAIRSYLEEFHEKNPQIQILYSLAHDGELLPEAVRLVLFRVLQESFANIMRHARATAVQVQFNFDAEEARIEISDNGKGFTVPGNWVSMVRAGHYGLAGMAERVNAAGGEFSIESTPGASTTVRAIIPYSFD